MKISGKLMNVLTQVIALSVLLGIVALMISVVRSGYLHFLTDSDAYADIYAYTEESSVESIE